MRHNYKQAVGIDISQERISIVLLNTGKNGLQLVKSASASLPEGAVKDGNIEDAAILTRAIRELGVRSKIRTGRAAVTLVAKPTVSQILDMPRQVPTNIRQFVQSEVKNCVALPSRDIVLDFCALGSGKRTTDKRILVVAVEEARMLELVGVCGKAGFEVETIEPALFAYLRAIYSSKIAGKGAANVLVAMLRGTVLTLCVVKNGSIDFIRTKETTDSGDLNRWLADELSEVVRFYDIEVPENIGQWDVTIFVDAGQSSEGLEGCLKSVISAANLQVRTIEDACADTTVDCSTAQKDDKPSPVAVGLAARLLKPELGDIKINLVPPRVIKAREAKLDAVIAANVIAAILLLMVLSIGGFAFMIKGVTRSSLVNKQLIAKQDTELMLQQHQNLDGRLNVLSTRLDRLSQISASHNDVNLVEMLDDIRKSTPGSVMISSISCQDGSRVLVEGLATSNEAVNLFVDLLEKSRIISSVALLEARKQDGQKNLITYQIGCKLVNRSPGSPG